MTPVQGVDQAFWYILGISVVLLFGITVVMIYFVVKYRRSKNPVATDIRDNYTLEIIWTIVPTIIALSMFYIGWTSYLGLRNVPDDAMEIEVLGQQYSWIFVYDNDKETENELVVPLGEAIKLNIESLDVLHSFFLPNVRVKHDVVPGKKQYVWFTPVKEGTYDIVCAELCGWGHYKMKGRMTVESRPDYEKWLKQLEAQQNLDEIAAR